LQLKTSNKPSVVRLAAVMRQRRPIAGEGAEDGGKQSLAEQHRLRQEKEKPLAIGLLVVICALPLVVAGLIKFFLPHVSHEKMWSRPRIHMGMSGEEVRDHLQNHTLLHIGGLHRSGTTFLWQALSKHSSVAPLEYVEGHTDVRHKGARHMKKLFNEGIFLQSVYPKFGLDHDKFLLRKWIGQAARWVPFLDEHNFPWIRLREGVGRFALHPDHHLTEVSPLVSAAAQEHLFNEWSHFWYDLSRPVLLEKSPSNMVISPFLHKLWGLGLPGSKSPARFIFMRRHPIPTALATARAGGRTTDDLTLHDLVEHWLAAEERLAEDLRRYFDVVDPTSTPPYKILKLETLVKEPRRTLQDLLEWLGLSLEEEEDWISHLEEEAHKDPNLKYWRSYCRGLTSGNHHIVEEFTDMVKKYGDRIQAVSDYNLREVVHLCHEVLLGHPAPGPAGETQGAEASEPADPAEPPLTPEEMKKVEAVEHEIEEAIEERQEN